MTVTNCSSVSKHHRTITHSYRHRYTGTKILSSKTGLSTMTLLSICAKYLKLSWVFWKSETYFLWQIECVCQIQHLKSSNESLRHSPQGPNDNRNDLHFTAVPHMPNFLSKVFLSFQLSLPCSWPWHRRGRLLLSDTILSAYPGQWCLVCCGSLIC